MNAPTQYELVVENSPEELSRKVSMWFSTGWKPYGSPGCTVSIVDGRRTYFQAVVKGEIKG